MIVGVDEEEVVRTLLVVVRDGSEQNEGGCGRECRYDFPRPHTGTSTEQINDAIKLISNSDRYLINHNPVESKSLKNEASYKGLYMARSQSRYPLSSCALIRNITRYHPRHQPRTPVFIRGGMWGNPEELFQKRSKYISNPRFVTSQRLRQRMIAHVLWSYLASVPGSVCKSMEHFLLHRSKLRSLLRRTSHRSTVCFRFPSPVGQTRHLPRHVRAGSLPELYRS